METKCLEVCVIRLLGGVHCLAYVELGMQNRNVEFRSLRREHVSRSSYQILEYALELEPQ